MQKEGVEKKPKTFPSWEGSAQSASDFLGEQAHPGVSELKVLIFFKVLKHIIWGMIAERKISCSKYASKLLKWTDLFKQP